MPGKPAMAALLAALLSAAPAAAQQGADPLAKGADFFLSGKLDSAIKFFSGAVQEDPKDARASEILGHCLAVKGIEALKAGEYGPARAALARAREHFPQNGELKTLFLLAELEGNAPTPAVPVSTSTAVLDSTAENRAVFECLFGDGPCARAGRFLVHIVQPGETMAEIAIKYYNDMKKWEHIWKANPQLQNPHRLEKGTRLLIPAP